MPSERNSDVSSTSGSPVFSTTHWSAVLAAGQDRSEAGAGALEQLCRTYWYPLYAYLRRKGFSEHDAQDLTQGFILQLLDRRAIEKVQPHKGNSGRFSSRLSTITSRMSAIERRRKNEAAGANCCRWN